MKFPEQLHNQAIASARGSLVLFLLACLFTALALFQLGLVERRFQPTIWLPALVVALCGGSAIYLLQLRMARFYGDPILLPLIYFLCGFGLALTSRLAPNFVRPQLFWLVIGTAALILINLLAHNLNWLHRYKYIWLSGGLLLLASTLFLGVNPSGFGARLWLQVGPFYVQPSELLKLLLIIFLAGYLADRRRLLIEEPLNVGPLALPHPSYFGPMFLMWGFSMVLLIWQRDLGAALLFFGTFLGMLYAVTGQARYLWVGGLLLVAAGVTGYTLFDVVRIRVDGFLNPWLDPAGRSFQIVQSLLAFASGGLLGEGLGQGLPTAIPVVHTDFVYAAIGEEYGLLGALGILVCFGLLVTRAFRLAQQARTNFEQLLAVGIGTMFGLQTLVITAGTLKLMPLTGVTLPFVSYGGSSLVMSFVMVALLQFIARENQRGEAGTPYVPRSTTRPNFDLKLVRVFAVGFAIVAGGLVLWQVVATPFLVSRRDNPRLVVEEQRIDRGRLLTRRGVPIAETVIGPAGLAERRYPYPGLSSVTGYYSLRYGVGGTEATFDPILRGATDQTAQERLIADLLHRPPVGQDVTLTVDLPAQVAADVALGDREGAVVVMEVQSGAVLVMSSHPTYDPNLLDEQWDSLRTDERAPLLNRATQGKFPVGDLARFIGLLGLYESGATVPVDPLAAPLDDLLAPLGPTGFKGVAGQLGFSQPLPGLRSLPGRLPDFEDNDTGRDLAVTPLHLARVVAGVERAGNLPTPILSPRTPPSQARGFRPDTARQVRAWFESFGETNGGGLVGWAGLASPEETGQRWLSWFVGLAPAAPSPRPGSEFASVDRSEEGLIFDPGQIKAVEPTFTPAPPLSPARYVVVVVVVTEEPDERAAIRIARAPLRSLAESEAN
jgi:peptidoglycan glycosyltransferase